MSPAPAGGATINDQRRDPLSVERLADLLRMAEQAHAQFERQLGQRDEEWPAWQARFIVQAVEER